MEEIDNYWIIANMSNTAFLKNYDKGGVGTPDVIDAMRFGTKKQAEESITRENLKVYLYPKRVKIFME